MLAAGVLALLMRVQLAVPENDFLSADRYNQFFTMHGSAMMFLFAVPIFEAISILILPAFLGARDMPFPRLSAYGYWCFLIGGVFVMGSVLFGAGPRAGWFMYPPLATQASGIGSDIWLLGLSFIEVASIAAAVELITGVLKCRPPGMRINLMPLYAWYVLVVGGMILFAFPPLIGGDLLFEMERSFDWPFFDPERGGDPLLWQHLLLDLRSSGGLHHLPALDRHRRHDRAHRRAAADLRLLLDRAVGRGHGVHLSFGLWVHHMYATGLPTISLAFFSAASEAVMIPTGVQIFAFLATLLVGRVTITVPMLFITGALAIFTTGGLTGVMVALVPFDWQAHDTYFVVAHLHCTLIGGMVFPVVAGVYYFHPFLTDKAMSDRLGRWALWLMFVGFSVTFLPMHLSGLRGMPRRVFTYPEGLGVGWLNLVSTLGAFVFAAGVLVFAWDLLRPKGREPYAPRNPWNAGTLGMVGRGAGQALGLALDPLHHLALPAVAAGPPRRAHGPGPLLPARRRGGPARDHRHLGARRAAHPGDARARPGHRHHGRRRLHRRRVHLPDLPPLLARRDLGRRGRGLRPLLAVDRDGADPVESQEGRGPRPALPLYASGPNACGWWGMFITMLGDATAFASLVFGFFFYWTSIAAFPPPGHPLASTSWAGAGAALIAVSWALTRLARDRNRAGSPGRCASRCRRPRSSRRRAGGPSPGAPTRSGSTPRRMSTPRSCGC